MSQSSRMISKYRRATGSVSIFFSLVLMLILSLLLTLAEGVHYTGLQADTRLVSRTAVENVMAEYNSELWKKYGILGLDMGYGAGDANPGELERRMLSSAQTNAAQNLYEMDISGCALDSYRLLSDDGCAGLIREAADAQKKKLGEYVADSLTHLYEDYKNEDMPEPDIDRMLEAGEQALQNAEQMTEESTEDVAEKLPSSMAELDVGDPPKEQSEAPLVNPIDLIASLRQKAVLSQVIPSEVELSGSSLGEYQSMEERHRLSGTIDDRLDIRQTEQILFRLYLLDHFTWFRMDESENTEEKVLSYAMEYILCGQHSDIANLEGIVIKILAMRESENYAAILADPSKVAELESLAWAIAGITANPLIVKAVKAALAAAWAYLESILDVRLLLRGGKVPLLKTPAQWTSHVGEFSTYLDAHVTARNVENGLEYRSYLMLLMLLSPTEKLALRSMDLMERTINLEEGYESMHMDHMVCEIRCYFEYEAQPLLLKWVTVGRLPSDGYKWKRQENASYL